MPLTKAIAALFEQEVKSSHEANGISESRETPLLLAREAGRGILADLGDTPQHVLEMHDGFVVAGDRAAVLLGGDGSVVIKDLPKDAAAPTTEQPVNEDAGDCMAYFNVYDFMKVGQGKEDAAKSVLEDVIADLYKPFNKLVKEALRKKKLPGGVTLKESEEGASATAPVTEGEKKNEGDAVRVKKNMVGGGKEGVVKSRSETSGFVVVKFPNGKTASYHESDLEKIDDDSADESLSDMPSATESDENFKKYVSGVKTHKKLNALHRQFKTSGRTALAAHTKAHATKLGYKVDDSVEEVAAAAIVQIENGLELREGRNGEGELLSTVTCDTTDEKALADAESKLLKTAAEMGLLPEAEENDFAVLEAKLLPAIIGCTVFSEIHEFVEQFDAAKAAGDIEKAISVAKVIGEATGTDLGLNESLVEGMRTKTKKKGRRPGPKTLVRKATTPPKPKLPVDVGPGAGTSSGGSVAGKNEGVNEEDSIFDGDIVVVSVSFPLSKGKAKKDTLDAYLTAEAERNGGEPYGSMQDPKADTLALNYAFNAESSTYAGAFANRMKKLATIKGVKVKSVDFNADDVIHGGEDESVKPKPEATPVEETWIEKARKMGVDEFVAHMEASAKDDLPEVFKMKVDALVENYKCGPGKKDMARKITAANPTIKKKTGKGISLEFKENAPALVGAIAVTFPKARVDEFLTLAREAGADDKSEVRMKDDLVTVTLPKPVAEKVLEKFKGDDVSEAASELK